jgi:hypothetical protein
MHIPRSPIHSLSLLCRLFEPTLRNEDREPAISTPHLDQNWHHKYYDDCSCNIRSACGRTTRTRSNRLRPTAVPKHVHDSALLSKDANLEVYNDDRYLGMRIPQRCVLEHEKDEEVSDWPRFYLVLDARCSETNSGRVDVDLERIACSRELIHLLLIAVERSDAHHHARTDILVAFVSPLSMHGVDVPVSTSSSGLCLYDHPVV